MSKTQPQSIQPTREEAINALQTLQKQREEEQGSRFSRLKGRFSTEVEKVEETLLTVGETTFKYIFILSFVFSLIFLVLFILAWFYINENRNKNTILKNGVFSDTTILYTIQIIGIILTLTACLFSGLGVFKYEMHRLSDHLNSPALKIFLIILFGGLLILFVCNILFFWSARKHDNSTTDTTKVDTASSSTIIDSTTTKTTTVITIQTTTKVGTAGDEGFSFNTATVLHLILNVGGAIGCLFFMGGYLFSAIHINSG